MKKIVLTVLALLLSLTLVLPAAAAGTALAVLYGYRQLGGMSGDIAGFALTLGELCGLAALILL